MTKLIQPPAHVQQDLSAYFQASARRGVGGPWAGRPTYPGYNRMGVGQQPDSSAPRPAARPDASGRFRDKPGGGGACGQDPVSTNYGGLCVCSPNECEYDPAIFCGWSALPFSTFKDQGDAPQFEGPVLASFGATRSIRITAERACLFRIRGLWMRAVDATDCSTTRMALLQNVLINETPRLIETGGLAAEERIGIPTSMFDSTFWVLPVDWGIIDPIQNNSRPLRLDFATPCDENVDVVGVLFGDPLVPGKSGPVGAYGNNMLFY